MKREKIRHPASYYLLLVIGSAVLLLLDRCSKVWAVKKLSDGSVIPLIKGVLELRYTENRGMAFSLLTNQRILFVVMTVVLVGGLVYLYTRLPQDRKFAPLAAMLIFIIGGALGNFYDRLVMGYVVDFIYISLIDFPIFNLADIFITWTAVIGAVVLFFAYKEEDLKKIRL